MKTRTLTRILISMIAVVFVFTGAASANQAPVVQNPIPDWVKQKNFAEFTAADLSQVFFDPDGDPLTYSAQSVDGNVTVLLTGNTVIIRSISGFTGVSQVEVTADDGQGGTAKDDFYVTVNVRITPPNGKGGDKFGVSLSLHGNLAAIGALGDDDRASNAGAVWVYDFVTSSTAKLYAPDSVTDHYFGESVSLNGNLIIVGAKEDSEKASKAGAAYLFQRESGGNWTQLRKIMANDGKAGDYFASAVAVSNNYAVVGSPRASAAAAGSGAAYIINISPGGGWLQQKLVASDGNDYDYFGSSVDISDDYVIIGAMWADAGGLSNCGAVYIYRRDLVDNVWKFERKLVGETVDAKFGAAVQIEVSAAGDVRAIIGAPGQAGAAYIYKRENNQWVLKKKLTASDGKTGDQFGAAVAISSEAAIVGAPGADSAYYFQYTENDGWTQREPKLTAGDNTTGIYFGSSVSISGFNSLVGAYGYQNLMGAVYSYDIVALNTSLTIYNLSSLTTQKNTSVNGTFNIFDPSTSGIVSVSMTNWESSTMSQGTVTFGGSGEERTVSVTPPANQRGTAKITITASNSSSGETATASFILKVTDPPVISAIPDQTMYEWDQNKTREILFDVTDATDPADSLIVNAFSSNTTLIPNANISVSFVGGYPNRKLTITPAAGQLGIAQITVTATDLDNDTSSTTFNFMVSAGPIFQSVSPSPISRLEDSAASETISVIMSNVVGSQITVSAESSNTTLIPNSNININNSGSYQNVTIPCSTSCSYDIMIAAPAINLNGETKITISVKDGSDKISYYQVPISVTPKPDPPEIVSVVTTPSMVNNTVTFDEGQKMTAVLTIRDVDGDSSVPGGGDLIVTVVSSNANLIPNTADHIKINSTASPYTVTSLVDFKATLNLEIIPRTNTFGTGSITITVSDGLHQVSQTIDLVVIEVNDTPEIIGEIPELIEAEEDQTEPIAYTFQVRDIDSDQMTITVVSNNQNLMPNANIKLNNEANTKVLSLPPNTISGDITLKLTLPKDANSDDFGDAIITLTVKDNSGDPATDTLTKTIRLTVAPTYDPPTIGLIPDAIEPDPMIEDTPRNFNLHIGCVDRTNVTLTVTSTNKALINDVFPYVKINGAGAPYTVPYSVYSVEPIVLTLTPMPDAHSDTLGETIIRVNAYDGTTTVFREFRVRVRPVNDAPTVAAIANQTMDEDTVKTFDFTVNDVDGDTLTLSILSDNPALIPASNIKVNDTALPLTLTKADYSGKTLKMTLTPLADQYGTANITVKVTDGLLEGSATFKLTVNPVNDPPVVSSVPSQTMDEDTTKTVPFSVTDVDGDLVTVTVTSSNTQLLPNSFPHIKINGFASPHVIDTSTSPVNLNLWLQPAKDQSGTAMVTIKADDGSGGIHSRTFLLTVNAVNDPPEISVIPNVDLPKGETYIDVTFQVRDVDGNNLTVSAASDNTSLLPNHSDNINLNGSGLSASVPTTPTSPSNVTVRLTPNSTQWGIANVTITASDEIAPPVTRSFEFRVDYTAQLLTISEIEDLTMDENSTHTVVFTVDGATSPTFSVTSSNPILLPAQTVTHMGGKLYSLLLDPTDNQYGVSTITIKATEGGKSDTESFVVTVRSLNNPPAIQLIGSQNRFTEEGKPVEVKFRVYDMETLPNNLIVSFTSNNLTLVPQSGMVKTGISNPSPDGHEADLDVRVTPAAGQYGEAVITVTIKDDHNATASASFNLVVSQADNKLPVIEAIMAVKDKIVTASDVTVYAGATITGQSGKVIQINLGDYVRIGANAPVVIDSATSIPAPAGATITVYETSETYISEITIDKNSQTDAIELYINDEDEDILTVTVSSSAGSILVPNTGDHINIDGFGNVRIVTSGTYTTKPLILIITPAPNQSGTETITVSVDDASGEPPVNRTFLLTVSPDGGANIIPRIDSIVMGPEHDPINIVNDVVTIVENTISDEIRIALSDGDNDVLELTITSDNPALIASPIMSEKIPPAVYQAGPVKLKITPTVNKTGFATITVKVVDDDGAMAEKKFYVRVTPTDLPKIRFDAAVDPDNLVMDEDGVLKVKIYVSDYDGDVLEMGAVSETLMLTPNNVCLTYENNYGVPLTDNKVYTTPGVEVPLYLVIRPVQDLNGKALIVLSAYEVKDHPAPPERTTYAYASLTVRPVPDKLRVQLTFNPADDPDGDGNPTIVEDSFLNVTITLTNPDREPVTDNVTISVSSMNTQLVPNNVANLHIGGEYFPYPFTLTQDSTGSRTLTVRPAPNANSELLDGARIKIDASNANGTTTVYFTLTVTPLPDLPVITATPPAPNNYWTIKEDNTTTSIPFTVGDPDGDELTITVVSVDNIDPMRPLLLPDEADHIQIIGAPNYKVTPIWNKPTELGLLVIPPPNANSMKSGMARILLRVTDGVDIAEKNFDVYVEPVPDKPEILGIYYNMAIATEENTPVKFSIYDPTPIDFGVRDVDWGVLTLQASSSDQSIVPNSNIWMFRRGESAGMPTTYTLPISNDNIVPMDMILKPAEDKFGLTKITIIGTTEDGRQAVTRYFYLEVTNVNKAPVINDIGNPVNMNEDTVHTVNFSVMDKDGDELRVILFSSVQSIVADTDLRFTATGTNTITFKPSAGVNYPLSFTINPKKNMHTQFTGPITILVRVEEVTTPGHPSPLTAQAEFPLTIHPVNDNPLLSSITDKTMDEDSPPVKIDFMVGDVDKGDILTVKVTSNQQKLFSDASLVVSDIYNRIYYEEGLAKLIADPPADPALELPNIPLKLTLHPLPNANSDLYGPATITVRVTDNSGASVERSFWVTVKAFPDPPTIDPIEDKVTDEDVPITVPFYVGDVDGDLLTVTVRSDRPTIVPNNTEHLRITGQSGIVGPNLNNNEQFVSTTVQASPTAKVPLNLTITPKANMHTADTGPVTMTLTVSDGVHPLVVTSFKLTIISVNDPPILSFITSPKFTQINTDLVIDFYVYDVETPYTQLIVFGVSSNQDIIPNTNITAVPITQVGMINYRMTIKPAFGVTGTAKITMTVMDELGAKATWNGAVPEFEVKVVPDGIVPEISPFLEPVYYTDEDTERIINFSIRYTTTTPPALNINIFSSDQELVPNANISYQYMSSEGDIHNYRMRIMPATNAPLPGKPNRALITLAASAGTIGVDYTDEQSLTLQVNPVNDPPELSGLPDNVTTNKNMPVTVYFRATDIETTADRLIITFTSSNTTLIPNANIVKTYLGDVHLNYKAVITPAKDQSGGPVTITVRVDDGSGAVNSVVTGTFTVTVGNVLAGDVNTDGKVNLTDVILALQIVAGIPVSNVSLLADINGDGRIGLAEAIYALQYTAEIR